MIFAANALKKHMNRLNQIVNLLSISLTLFLTALIINTQNCIDTNTEATPEDSTTPTSEELNITPSGRETANFSKSQFEIFYNSAGTMTIQTTGGSPSSTITFKGNTKGTYDIGAAQATFTYTDSLGNTYTASSGSIEATYVGGVGDYVSGNINISADDPQAASTPISVTGNWNRLRASDQ